MLEDLGLLLWVWLGFVAGGGGGRSRVDFAVGWLWVSIWWWVCYGFLGFGFCCCEFGWVLWPRWFLVVEVGGSDMGWILQ